MTKTIRLSERYKPLPEQYVFHQSKKKYAAYIGGIGGGKTYALCWDAFITGLAYPGTEILLGRQFYKELKATTMTTFFREVMPKELYDRSDYSKEDMRLIQKPIGPKRLQTIYWFRALEDPVKLKGLNLGWAGVDEVNETSLDSFQELDRRTRNPKGPGLIRVVGEDAGRNWVYHWFHPNGNNHDPELSEIFLAKTKDNTYLPKDFIDKQYRGMSPEMIARYLEPSFQLIGGAVYKEWNPAVHIIDPFEIPEHWPLYRVIDPGLTNVTCCLLYTVDPGGTYYFMDEYYQEDVTVAQAVQAIRLMTGDLEPRVAYTLIDPHAMARSGEKFGKPWSMANDYTTEGIWCLPANNDVDGGINKVRQYLHQNKVKFFRHKCPETVDEFPDYEYRKPRNPNIDDSRKEKPKHVRCHGLDCVKYAVSDSSDGALIKKRPDPYAKDRTHTYDWQTAAIPGA